MYSGTDQENQTEVEYFSNGERLVQNGFQIDQRQFNS